MLLRSVFITATAIVCHALVATTAYAAKRAYVVAINEYIELPKLKTAVADAAAIGGSLAKLGFTVDLLKEPTRSDFDQAWGQFLSSLEKGDTVAIYFAGHGVQVGGANYLLLKDTPTPDVGEDEVLAKGINFHELMQDVEARQLAATIYILDACRDNPFAGDASKASRTLLGQTKGLARMESVYGAFVMYSAGADEQAIDQIEGSPSPNSVFMTRLLPLLAIPELSLVEIAKRVQVGVEEDARRVQQTQRPAYFDGIVGQYFLKDAGRTDRPLSPGERIPSENYIPIAAFATWDANCRSRPAPNVTGTSPLKYGRIITRFETFPVGGTHFGVTCVRSEQRGIGVYYLIESAYVDSTRVERVNLRIQHWSTAPATTVNESFDVDLATRFNRRTTGRPPG